MLLQCALSVCACVAAELRKKATAAEILSEVKALQQRLNLRNVASALHGIALNVGCECRQLCIAGAGCDVDV